MKGEVLLSSNSLLTADNVPVKSITHLNKATAEISIFPQNLFPRAHSLLFKISSSQMKTKFVISKPGFPNKKHSTWNTKKKSHGFSCKHSEKNNSNEQRDSEMAAQLHFMCSACSSNKFDPPVPHLETSFATKANSRFSNAVCVLRLALFVCSLCHAIFLMIDRGKCAFLLYTYT